MCDTGNITLQSERGVQFLTNLCLRRITVSPRYSSSTGVLGGGYWSLTDPANLPVLPNLAPRVLNVGELNLGQQFTDEKQIIPSPIDVS